MAYSVVLESFIVSNCENLRAEPVKNGLTDWKEKNQTAIIGRFIIGLVRCVLYRKRMGVVFFLILSFS